MKPATVTLDADHRYWADNGKTRWEIPGVSFLLEWKFGKNPWFAKGRPGLDKKGSLIHRACTLDNQGILDDSSVAPEIKPYLDALRALKVDKRIKILRVECICYDLQLGYAGMFDFEATWSYGPRPFIGEIKTGGKTDTHWLQGAAYVRGCPDWRTRDVCIIYLKPNGKYTLDFYQGQRLIEAVKYWEAIPREYSKSQTEIPW